MPTYRIEIVTSEPDEFGIHVDHVAEAIGDGYRDGQLRCGDRREVCGSWSLVEVPDAPPAPAP